MILSGRNVRPHRLGCLGLRLRRWRRTTEPNRSPRAAIQTSTAECTTTCRPTRTSLSGTLTSAAATTPASTARSPASDYAEDRALIDPGVSDLDAAFILMQNGNTWVFVLDDVPAGGWTTVEQPGLTPADFTFSSGPGPWRPARLLRIRQ